MGINLIVDTLDIFLDDFLGGFYYYCSISISISDVGQDDIYVFPVPPADENQVPICVRGWQSVHWEMQKRYCLALTKE